MVHAANTVIKVIIYNISTNKTLIILLQITSENVITSLHNARSNHPKRQNEMCGSTEILPSVEMFYSGLNTKEWDIRGGADKSLARPGRKQATETKLGI